MATKIILDVDTGSDDAVALMAAIKSPDIELLAACTVAGNKDIEKTTENTLRVMQAMEADIPVYRGCAKPLVKFLLPNRLAPSHRATVTVDGKELHMHEDYLELPPANRKPEALPAPAFYVQRLREARQSGEKITIVAVGPLTNLAVALLMDPDCMQGVERIVIMGGGYKVVNSTSSAEFNIWYDAEAAEYVLKCGAKTLWVPLDATHAAYLTLADCERMRALGTVAGDFAADLIAQRITVHNSQQPLAVPDAAAVHDALAVCAVIDESVLKSVEHVHMDIALGDYAEGQTVVDPRYYPDERNCWFAFDGDPDKFADMMCDILGR